ncbi:Type II secretory pathway, pseudopilin PulG [Georgenia satyanarayanai]|uniref:Type II secretory pathway, pseudopilin PulG n=1 Tax=Georgenia satyanarayanai TaxID=860221 RepID=A0A2Y9AS33_9MICO|nr:DUF4012 domain-containing protein [Georgenia satyanarayanai]PYF95940.1 type II secretory pathway pseudopilin PulG [Georgenia satyanarayanai]SSA47261.1 Type II secretory pathway, pseudopilin PulG [Georgenia satyanarayanai]
MTDNFPSWLDDDGGSATPDSRPGARAGTASASDGGPSRRRRQKKRRGRTVLTVVIVAVLLGLIALLVLFALQGRTAVTEMRAAMPQVSELREQALSGQTDAADGTAAELREHTSAARDAVAGPHWAVAAKLPWVGPNVEAVRTATVVVDDLAADALPDLVAATDAVDPARLAPQDGRIDLAPFAEVAPRVVAANEAVLAGRDRLDTVDSSDLVGTLGDQIDSLKGQVGELAGLTATASRAVQLIPPMLGADEPRDYIFMVQNNAEPRSTGGLTGAFLLLRADDGAVELVEQRSAGEVGYFGDGAVELTETEIALFGTQLARYPGNVTATPDFPRSAEIIRAMWSEGVGGEVDGVLSLDPVALGGLLEATGPIGLDDDVLAALGVPSEMFDGDAQLNADNAADIMLNGVYRYIEDTGDQDAFFEVAAAEIFSAVMDGEAAPAATVASLVQAADEGRLLVWSAHDQEQELLSGTTLSGELRGDDGHGAPVVGVYVNDLSAAKIAYYQRMEVEVEAQQCHANGNQDLTVSVTLTSDVPDGAADLPDSLAGNGRVVDKGDMRSNLFVYAPTGGRITDVRDPDTEAVGAFPQVHDQQVVVGRRVNLSPGDSVTTQFDITTGPGFTGDAVLRMTPGPGSERYVSSTLTCRH